MTMKAKLLVALILAVAAIVISEVGHASEEVVVAPRVLLNAAAADETANNIGTQLTRCRETAVYVEWSTGVTSGVVQVESASSTTYAGTWAPISTVTFSGTAPKADVVQITGVHGAMQTRISTVVANGTVTTRIVCN